MADTSSNLLLPYLAAGQAQKHVTVNESLLRLDALTQLAVESASTASEPASPSDGAIWILPSGKTGAAWGGMANGALAYWRDGVWEEIAPRHGWIAAVRDTNRVVVYDGAAWNDVGGGASVEAGTFTPAVNFDTPGDFAPTYVGQKGAWRRIGDVCFYSLYVAWHANAYTGASGKLHITGLPFTVVEDSQLQNFSGGVPIINNMVLDSADRWAVVFARHNTTQLWIYTLRSASALQQAGAANFPPSTNNFSVRVAGSYIIKP